MAKPKYLVRLKMDDVIKTELWSSDHPLKLGYGLPYRLVRKNTRVYIEHRAGKIWEIKSEQIEKKSPVLVPNFKNSLKEELFLRIENIKIESAYFDHISKNPLSKEIEIISRTGQWIYDSCNIGSGYTARYRSEKIFRIIKIIKDRYTLKMIASNVYFNESQIKDQIEIGFDELIRGKISFKNIEWSFRAQESIDLSNLPIIPVDDSEEIKGFGAIALFTGLFVGLALLFFTVMGSIHDSSKNKIKESEFAKIILPKKAKNKMNEIKIKRIIPNSKKIKIRPNKNIKIAKQDVIYPKGGVKKSLTIKNNVRLNKKKIITKASGKNPKNKKTVSRAVLRAKKLRTSLSGLLGGSKSILLSKSNKVMGLGLGKPSGRIPGVRDKSKLSAAPITQIYDEQKVKVGYSDGGKRAVSSGLSYRSGYQGKARVGGGTSFVSIGAGLGSGRLKGNGLTKKEVWTVINRHITEVRKCYEEAIIRLPNAEGKLVVGFTITPKGRVIRAKVNETTIRDKPIGQCVVKRLGKWKFPRPKGKAKVSVQYPFIFRRL